MVSCDRRRPGTARVREGELGDRVAAGRRRDRRAGYRNGADGRPDRSRRPAADRRRSEDDDGPLLRLPAVKGLSQSHVGRRMTLLRMKSWRACWLTIIALVLASVFTAGLEAQTFFYNEVERDGRIYVFAKWRRYDEFIKPNVGDTGRVIERPGYGPHGETVVFDSELAINLYNFKH